MIVIDKKYVNEINCEIPFDIRGDFHKRTKIKEFIMPVNATVTLADRYILEGLGFETLEVETYLNYGDDIYHSYVLDNHNGISLLRYHPLTNPDTLGDLFKDFLNVCTSVELLYDDSDKRTKNKIAFIFTLPPEKAPELVTFFIKKTLIKDIKGNIIKASPWVSQFLE